MARRCGKVFKSKQDDKSQRSYDVSLLLQVGTVETVKEEPIDDDAEVDDKEEDDGETNATTKSTGATNGVCACKCVCCTCLPVYMHLCVHLRA